jgi:putative restriction endonuclease
LPRRELLDAAHIEPDREARGEPSVNNGLALCKLHHGAYDANLLGIRPDLVIELSQALLDTHDGPTLEHGLKGFAGKTIHPPRRAKDHPAPEHLEARYAIFRRSA